MFYPWKIWKIRIFEASKKLRTMRDSESTTLSICIFSIVFRFSVALSFEILSDSIPLGLFAGQHNSPNSTGLDHGLGTAQLRSKCANLSRRDSTSCLLCQKGIEIYRYTVRYTSAHSKQDRQLSPDI